LNSEALAALQGWHDQSADATGLLFPGKYGTAFNNVRRSWDGVLKAAKITGFRWHEMRYDFASKLVMAGVDLNTARELLGHSDHAMTEGMLTSLQSTKPQRLRSWLSHNEARTGQSA
jgi:integrase